MKITRRQFMGGLSGAGLLGVGAVGYMRWVEPDWFEVTKTVVTTGRNHGGAVVRVLHLSDLHASDVVPLPMIAQAIELGLAENPDLVVLTGDFWTTRYGQISNYAEVLKPLAKAAPTFAVVGNHDGGRWARGAGGWASFEPIGELLVASGVSLLWNKSVRVQVGGRVVELVGVGDHWAGDCHSGEAFGELDNRKEDDAALRLVLNHNPDAKDEFRGLDWDLMLCGHTHGGQLKLPLFGTPFAPVHDHRFVTGLNPWEGHQIFTTRGVGNLHGLRFNCRPEVSLLDVS